VSVISSKYETANRLLLDGVQLRHEFREELIARFIKKRPPCFFAVLG
jgi:hypothetical protein